MKLLNFKLLGKTTWFVIISGLVILGVWLLVILPTVHRLQSTAESIRTTQAATSTTTEATANLIHALQKKAQLTDDVQRLEAMYINRSNPITAVSRLEELASDAHVTLDVSLQQPTPLKGQVVDVTEALATLTVAGQLSDVLTFTHSLSAEPLIFNVYQFDISTPSDTSGVVTLELQAKTYWK